MWQTWFQKIITKSDQEVTFFENGCLSNNGITCTVCVDFCRSGAFQLKNGKVTFDPANCTKCKLCSHCCPSEAIYIESELIFQYEQKIKQREDVRFTCPLHANTDIFLIVPCLSILSPEIILIAFIHNKHVQIYFEPMICKSCKFGWSMENSIMYLQELNYVAKGRVEVVHEEFDRLKMKKVNFSNLWLEFVRNWLIPELNQIVERRNKRSYLIEYLEKEGKDRYLSIKLANALRLTKIYITNECTLCGVCVEKCPTRVLEILYEKESKMLLYDPMKCIGCGYCVRICPYISLSPETKLSKDLLERKILKEVLNE